MVLEDDIVKYALALPDVSVHDEKEYKIFLRGETIFALFEPGKEPLRMQVRCDRELSKTLQERYESVMESRALGRNGIEIICSGQLTHDEVIDLVRHGYEQSAPKE
ncbi:MAG: MmcQ/YjbR family DNA-binding protein [Candidatus Saccharibacteria bacterium]|nr:MmcQ/YjbR family DNA-binding protein [Candidatus Saccharibacteria bacterium]